MHRTLKPIRYVFYRILMWKLSDARESTPIFVACMATSLLLFCNVLAAFMVANVLGGRDVLPKQRLGNVAYGVVAILLLVSSWLMNSAWVADGRFAKLEKEFMSGTERRERVRIVLFWAYVILSLALPIALAIAWHAMNT
jgi:hypothetical protein